MTPTTLNSSYVRGLVMTILITVIFAALWGVSGSVALPNPYGLLTAFLIVLITFAWFVVARLLHRVAGKLPTPITPSTNPFSSPAYRFSVIAQFVAIPIAARILSMTGHPDAIVSAVALIVGLHFFGLIPAFKSWQFAVVGSALALLAFASLLVPPHITTVAGQSLALRAVVVGFGCSLILWISILPAVLATRKRLRAAGVS